MGLERVPPWAWALAGLALVASAGAGASASSAPRPSPAPAPSPGDGGGGSGNGGGSGGPLEKPDLLERLIARINEANRELLRVYPCRSTPCMDEVVARAILEASKQTGVPLPVLAATVRRESSFWPTGDPKRWPAWNYDYLVSRFEDQRVKNEGCPSPWPMQLVTNPPRMYGLAIGPLQVKPAAFCDVGLRANKLLELRYDQGIYYAVLAGAKYLAMLRQRFPGIGWRGWLYGYKEGPGALKAAMQSGQWRQDILSGYCDRILTWAAGYPELA